MSQVGLVVQIVVASPTVVQIVVADRGLGRSSTRGGPMVPFGRTTKVVHSLSVFEVRERHAINAFAQD